MLAYDLPAPRHATSGMAEGGTDANPSCLGAGGKVRR